MKNSLVLLAVASLLLAGCRKANNQQPQPPATVQQHFTSQNSPLPDNQVNAVSVAGGSLWIGTQHGLARFANGVWTVFTANNSGLPSSTVLSLAATAEDSVWIGTDKGLVHYGNTRWTVYNPANSQMKNGIVKELLFDQTRKVLWAGTEGGLLRLSGAAQQWFDDSSSGLMENLVTALALTPGGNLLVGTFDPFRFQGSVWRYEGNSWERVRLNDLGYASSFVNTLFAGDTDWWIGLGGTSTGAVISMRGVQRQNEYHNQNSPVQGGVSEVVVKDGTLWAASSTGLLQLKDGWWKSFTAINSPLPDDRILCMEAAGGKLYLGMLQSGLVVLRP
jgi:ligand-binding sensor domain-containing protein